MKTFFLTPTIKDSFSPVKRGYKGEIQIQAWTGQDTSSGCVVHCEQDFVQYPGSSFLLSPFGDVAFLNENQRDFLYDVALFCERIPLHQETLTLLTHIGKGPLGWDGEFSILYAGDIEDVGQTPAGVAMYAKPPFSSEQKINATKKAKIVLGISTVFKNSFVSACEVLSSILAGAYPLVDTETYACLSKLLPVQCTFAHQEDALKKIYEVLGNEEERIAITQDLQKRVLLEASSLVRANELRQAG